MLVCDCHMHTKYSADSDASIESMIEASISKGLKTICFTDHMDLDFPSEYNMTFEFDVNDYFDTLERLKSKYKDDININIGIELGLMPHLASRYNKLINDYNFDFVIGSSHLVNMKDPYYSSFWENISTKEGLNLYFKSIIENISSFDGFDVYGHIDYIIRYCPDKSYSFSYEDYSEIIDCILKTLISKGKGIEINTAGYKYGLNAPNPGIDIIKRYIELGGNILTIGADAHKPEHIAYDYDSLYKLLKDNNISAYCYFEKRKPVHVTL